MKKALFKDSIKEIKNTYKKFISILLMAFLGVGFFAGIRAASPDMLDTLDKYYKEQNVYDIQIISTLGLTDEDVTAISQVENVQTVDVSFETDGIIETDNRDTIVKLISLGELNKVVLLDGNLPENANECVVEEKFLSNTGKKIGDVIDVNIETVQNDNGDEIQYLKNNQMKIVGTVKSPLYIARDRGTSTLGVGKIDYFVYIPEENVNVEIYTKIYVKVKDADKYITSEDKYENYIEKVKNDIESIKEEREVARKESLINIANQKILDAENELNTQKADAESKIQEAENEIADAKVEIANGEAEITKNRNNANTQFANAQKEIDNAKTLLEKNEQELNTKEQEAETSFAELEKQKQELQTNLDSINSTLPTLQSQYATIVEVLKDTTLTEEQKEVYVTQKATLDAQIQQLEQSKVTLEAGIKQIDDGITTGKQEIESAKTQIEQAKKELNNKQQELNSAKTSTYSKLSSAQKEIDNAKVELANGEKTLEENKAEFAEKVADAENKLADAKQKVEDIENPKWYVLDRNSNSGYASFIQDKESIASIGNVFPLVFFAVAALISLTSMTRMVEEQRMQIGTLKALGYNQIQIVSKYLIYATLASVIGSTLGMIVGFYLLPTILWSLYKALYTINDTISLGFRLEIGGLGLLLISICIIGATLYAALKELKSTPASLMRPKAPKSGNRVLLEKVTFIWKRLNFSHKVTVRNIFRYKKRFIMTIIGILGCTSLLVTGFGIKDSIGSILTKQYDGVFNYDLQISLKNENDIEEIKANTNFKNIIETHMTSVQALNGDLEEDIQIVVPKENFEGLINLNNVETKEKLELKDDEIYLTDKAAELLNVKQGDTIKLKDSDDKEYEVKVSNVIENYVSHYIYMTKGTYEKMTEETYETNVLLAQNIELSTEEEDAFITELMQIGSVSGVTRASDVMSILDDTLGLLDYVVIILIVSAGLLAFVVLYNLENVNISERIRELATIKVLGFYDKEVYNYVSRESTILTIIGIALGLGAGYGLNYFILGTCEIDMLRFAKVVKPISYLYSIAITIIFTLIVNIATYFSLKKINMIESLKSVE